MSSKLPAISCLNSPNARIADKELDRSAVAGYKNMGGVPERQAKGVNSRENMITGWKLIKITGSKLNKIIAFWKNKKPIMMMTLAEE